MTEIDELRLRIEALEQALAALTKTRPRKTADVDIEALIQVGMHGDIATDFLAHRRAIKAPLTATALKSIVREAQKAGICMDTAVTLMMNRGWRGLNADWVPKTHARDLRAGDSDFLKRLRGGDAPQRI